ncbi:MAG TPA: glycerate kinase [Candidatus Obscuribacterales bacterium]
MLSDPIPAPDARRFLIACDKFKGTLDSGAVNQALARGILAACPRAEIETLTVSDGGQGFLQAIGQNRELELIEVPCRDALGRPRQGPIGWDPESEEAFVESALAIGLPWLAPQERNPWLAHSAGLGDLILAARELRPKSLYIGLGGSACCDGGLGCLEVLGWRFYDQQSCLLPGLPESLSRIWRIEAPKRIWETNKPSGPTLICDVNNPPLGEAGGVRVYSPQKGADPEMVEKLEAGMQNWLKAIDWFRAPKLHPDPAWLMKPMGGAAGCLGLGLNGLLQAPLVPGADWILRQLAFPRKLDWADVVITGEGAFDRSSLQGKITGRILSWALRAGRPAVLISGQDVADLPAAEIGPTTRIFSLQALAPSAGHSPERSLQLLEQIGTDLAAGS